MVSVDRRDFSGLCSTPVNELTDEELKSLRVIFAERYKGSAKTLGELSDDAWAEAMRREDAVEVEKAFQDFLDCQGSLARMVRTCVAERDVTDADAVIGFLCGDGLLRDSQAAMVMLREYGKLLRGMGEIRAGQIVDTLICFYGRLGRAFKSAGIDLTV
jgi:hypothetical protein